MNKLTRKIIRLFGMVGLTTHSVLFIYIFLCAFVDPSKTVLINIDFYGEAVIELIITLFLIPFIVLTVKDYCLSDDWVK